MTHNQTRPLLGAVLTLVLVVFVSVVSSARASFGIAPGSFSTSALNRDGSVDTQAGSHPYSYTVSFRFNQDAKGEPEGEVRDVVLDLPRGLVGDPLAVPRCPHQDFEGQQALCPGDTQVGVLDAQLKGLGRAHAPVFNLVPPPGVPARLGFSATSLNALLDASVRTGAGYGIAVSANNIPTHGIVSITSTIWGVPPDKGHDPERQCVNNGAVVEGCSSEAPPRPFLTLPTSCTGPLSAALSADSIQEPGSFVPNPAETAFSLDAGKNPVGLSGCEKLSFGASLDATPDTTSAEAPAGLNVDLQIPQPESPEGLAEANLKEALVKLPIGMTVSPSAANGLGACPLDGPEGVGLGSSQPARCPNSSKVGTVEVQTPLLEHPLKGSVFLAQQGDLEGNGSNPFKSLLAMYVVIEGEGVAVKLPGLIELDETTGQLTARFGKKDPITGEESLPQLPFGDLKMSFFGGPRAPLITPPGCGTYTTVSQLTPWNGGPPVEASSSFTIDQGCGGGGFSPSFTAGSADNQGGAYTPFSVTFSRHDGEQRFAGAQVTAPPGLLATLKNVTRCPEPQASLGECPPASLIGETTVAAGPGADPYWVKGGRVYLTGPYHGAPFGLTIAVPAVAGPFNLGDKGGPVIVRARIDVDPHTAQAIVTSDPLPRILKGVPLDVRTVNVTIDRKEFIFNPTDCDPLHATATLSSTANTAAQASSPFQAGGCASLPFKPSFKVSTQAKTSKANGAGLDVTVASGKGQANIAKV
ncbi:MAG TPA: hypothetical protein VES65_03955, partial [Solirubrobacteraceae bacterium]|nr:hypothetical protein [Solirubrobacteraceae bacterium]